MRRFGVAVVIGALALAAPASATWLPGAHHRSVEVGRVGRYAPYYPNVQQPTLILGSDWAQRRADASKMPEPLIALNMVWGECPSWSGHADACTDFSTIWERPNLAARLTMFDFYHELGHSFDHYVMTDTARAQFISIIHDHPGWSTPDPAGFNTVSSPLERFADAYALCAIYGPQLPESQIEYTHDGTYPVWSGNDLSAYGYDPTPAQHAAVCHLIVAAFHYANGNA